MSRWPCWDRFHTYGIVLILRDFMLAIDKSEGLACGVIRFYSKIVGVTKR